MTSAAVKGIDQGRYSKWSLIAKSERTEVYVAFDTLLMRDVVVKRILGAQALDFAIAEARSAARVNHPHIATVYELEIQGGVPALITEYLSEGTLDAQVNTSHADLLSYMEQLLDALSQLHQQNIIHGDIKPANIGITAGGAAKFLDFGLSNATSPTTRTSGTLLYQAPENLFGENRNKQTDLWALCMTFYESLTGVNPMTRQIVAKPEDVNIPPLHNFKPALPLYLSHFFSEVLNGDRTKRPQTAEETRRLLKRCQLVRRAV